MKRPWRRLLSSGAAVKHRGPVLMFQSAGDVLSTTAVQFHSSTVAKLARSSLLKLLRSEAAQGTIQSDSDFNLAVGMWIDSAVNALGGRKVQS